MPPRTITVELTVRQTWELPEHDVYSSPEELMSEYLAVPGQSSLDEDYGREAWGGWEGPICVSSEVSSRILGNNSG